jgi:cytochrome subunit of sulfide dehydrogenase
MVARSMAFVVGLAASAIAMAQDATHIRLLASNCANCHGTDGRSQGGMPALTGQLKPKLLQDLQEFKSGNRPATIMHQIAKGYTDAELDALAGYFAAQKN